MYIMFPRVRHLLLGLGLLAIQAWASAVYSAELSFPRADRLSVMVDVTSINCTLDECVYKYVISSSDKSEQDMESINVKCGVPPIEVMPTDNWNAMGRLADTDYYGWAAKGIEAMLKPGGSIYELTLSSRGLPGLSDFIALGFIPFEELPTADDLPPENPFDPSASILPGQDVLENSFKGVTVGPEILPESLTAKGHLERLVTLKDQVAKLGWIKDPGTVTSLNQKLANALEALKRGNRKACKNILGAFVQELDAQKDKHLNSNAYYLLKVNAEYISNEALKPPWYWPF